MADNYLITGYHGQPHVTAENDRGINAGIVGEGKYVLPVGQQFKAEYIGGNIVRLYDGKLMDNGAAAGIPNGEYIDLHVTNATQGMNRKDYIIFQYSKDPSTLIENGAFIVLQGEESTGTAVPPTLTLGNLLDPNSTMDQMALWQVNISSTTIAIESTPLFAVSDALANMSASSAVEFNMTDDGTLNIFTAPHATTTLNFHGGETYGTSYVLVGANSGDGTSASTPLYNDAVWSFVSPIAFNKAIVTLKWNNTAAGTGYADTLDCFANIAWVGDDQKSANISGPLGYCAETKFNGASGTLTIELPGPRPATLPDLNQGGVAGRTYYVRLNETVRQHLCQKAFLQAGNTITLIQT